MEEDGDVGEKDCNVLTVFGRAACLNRELANRTKLDVGYLGGLI